MRRIAWLGVGATVLLVGAPSLEAHDPTTRTKTAPGRYSLARFWNGTEVQVLDRNTGRLFVLDAQRNEAYVVDPLRGTLVARKVQQVESKVTPQGKPTWPARDTDHAHPRFVYLGQRNRGTFAEGGAPAVYDVRTGRVFRVENARVLVILDAVQARITRQILHTNDTVGLAARNELLENEQQAQKILSQIAAAQRVFLAGDTDHDDVADYGTLTELAKAKLIDPGLALGVKNGYRFSVRPSRLHPQRVWMATANPVKPGKSGKRHFVITYRGIVYASPRAVPLNDRGTIPSDAQPVR